MHFDGSPTKMKKDVNSVFYTGINNTWWISPHVNKQNKNILFLIKLYRNRVLFNTIALSKI